MSILPSRRSVYRSVIRQDTRAKWEFTHFVKVFFWTASRSSMGKTTQHYSKWITAHVSMCKWDVQTPKIKSKVWPDFLGESLMKLGLFIENPPFFTCWVHLLWNTHTNPQQIPQNTTSHFGLRQVWQRAETKAYNWLFPFSWQYLFADSTFITVFTQCQDEFFHNCMPEVDKHLYQAIEK